MSEAPHKKSPPSDEEDEIITDEFRREAREALEANRLANRYRHLKKGAPGYLVSNRVELAVAIGIGSDGKSLINRIIGPVKSSTKVRLLGRSVYVGRIRSVLKLSNVTKISVRADRAEVLRFLDSLSAEKFKIFEDEYKREMKKLEQG